MKKLYPVKVYVSDSMLYSTKRKAMLNKRSNRLITIRYIAAGLKTIRQLSDKKFIYDINFLSFPNIEWTIAQCRLSNVL
ncbi:hypothetical protein [Enterococcus sp. CWB-B31]|uniref:hypothetical protein n=1 Tax=Enterococcus sp. CWB-B31 TaxID=2885159 RepID=UPI001E508765|nr:hypothetical protein [Enterococcus sp. CWB-B31]MCB5956191.1 hypothetical protein [Enterococcus sp. CWB-B31]